MENSCNDCIRGTIRTGQPVGEERMIHGLNTYVVGNTTNPRGILVVYSDVFGLSLVNNKLLADAYAEGGEWLVYLPDFFIGDPVPLKTADVLIPVDASKQSTLAKYTGLLASAPSFIMWRTRHRDAPTNKTCMDFLGALRREQSPDLKIGMVGICWGGKYALRAGLEINMITINNKPKSLIDAIVVLHPSNLSLPEDVDGLVVPASYGWGFEDQNTKIELKTQVEEIHRRAKIAGKHVPEMVHNIYKPGRHGFAVRGNPDDPQERACLEDSVTQVREWFQKVL